MKILKLAVLLLLFNYQAHGAKAVEQALQQEAGNSEVASVISAEELVAIDTLLLNIQRMIADAKRNNLRLNETIYLLTQEVDSLKERLAAVKEKNEILDKRNSRFLLR